MGPGPMYSSNVGHEPARRRDQPVPAPARRNPVDWYPWGEEALGRARAEDRPILLSIGYSACHWCHVMAHESFEDPETAALMNRLFVNIKVDREERPDLDAVYMNAVVQHDRPRRLADDGVPDARTAAVLRRHLLPARAPPRHAVVPPGAGGGRPRPGASGAARSQRAAAALADALQRGGGRRAVGRAARPSERADRRRCRCCARSTTREFGGFGGAPKFPPPRRVELPAAPARPHRQRRRAARWRSRRSTGWRSAACTTWSAAGSTATRSTRMWLVPHFEKMLYDNALLAAAYLEAHAVTGEHALPRGWSSGTLDYMLRELRLPDGRRSPRRWTPTPTAWRAPPTSGRRRSSRGAGRRRMRPRPAAYYGVDRAPATSRANDRPAGAGRAAAPICDDDPARRCSSGACGAPQPGRDDKAIAAWNGLALAALAQGGWRLRRPDCSRRPATAPASCSGR